MHVIDVPGVIGLVTNDVLPEALPPCPSLSFVIRTFERRSVRGSACTNRILIASQRLEKSSSPGGKVQMQCR